MVSLLIERLKTLTKPHVVFWHKGFRYEGIILSIDDTHLELHDGERCYRKFLRVAEVEDLEVKE